MVKKISLLVILITALVLRTYRINDFLGFYYDQGRDAKIIWDLWHKGKTFLIGPTTGLEGVFLGPFYYYLIAPAYLLGGGDPVFPAIWLIVINILGIYVIYRIGKDFFNDWSGILAAGLIAISSELIQAHRWLSNPTPLPLFSAISVWLLLKIIVSKQGNVLNWSLLGLGLGLSLQLEAASAIFFLPATLIILLINKTWPKIWMFLTFGITLLPQIVFNFRHQNILLKAFYRFLSEQKSYEPVNRLAFYFEEFANKFVLDGLLKKIFIIFIIVITITVWKKINKKPFLILLIWWVTPLVFLLFYHGNYGYVWGYYFTGVFSIVSLLVGIVLAVLPRPLAAAIIVLIIVQNFLIPKNQTDITLKTSLAAVDWIYRDAEGKKFNVDVYVPPVISHSYDYLFLWRGNTKWGQIPSEEKQKLLYTLFEADPPHPERLEKWLDRQEGIGTIELQQSFGGVTSQRRKRL